jgi:hypothetical protein
MLKVNDNEDVSLAISAMSGLTPQVDSLGSGVCKVVDCETGSAINAEQGRQIRVMPSDAVKMATDASNAKGSGVQYSEGKSPNADSFAGFEHKV